MSLTKSSKMLQFVNYRMRITLDDKRTLVGRFLAFDKHMNVVLADCEEFRRAKKSVRCARWTMRICSVLTISLSSLLAGISVANSIQYP